MVAKLPAGQNSVLNFRLGKLSYFNSSKIFNDPDREEQDSVVLDLSLAYNDIHDLLFYWDLLDEFKPRLPEPGTVCAKFGQYTGMKWHVFRFVSALLHEVVNLISKNSSVFECESLKRVFEKMDPAAKKSVNRLINFSLKKDMEFKDAPVLRRFLAQIRNNSAHHYYDPSELVKSYKLAFARDQKDFDGRAYFCKGESLEGTRFHFSDAAVEAYVNQQLGHKSVENQELLKDFVQDVHVGLYYLIPQYLKQIQADIYTLGSAEVNHPKGPPLIN